MLARGPDRVRAGALCALAIMVPFSDAAASTVAQNVAWTIDRPESETSYRIVSYGDSIFAGYRGSISSVAVWAAPSVDGDYLSAAWGSDVEIIRRSKSGATARQVYEDKIVDDKSWMQEPGTRVVAFEMCGNDALHARNNFSGQGGACDYSELDDALADCTSYLSLAMNFINANAAASVDTKVVTNIYYAGYDEDDVEAGCTDEASGEHPRKQDVFLPYLMRINWRTCQFASQKGFRCADSFAQFMGADFDSNGDGKVDSRALRFHRGESEDDYARRIGTTLRATIRDSNVHFFRATRTYDHLQSDDTHPTYIGDTIHLGILGGSGSGQSGPRFALDRYHRGKTTLWKKYGHERMGRALSVYNPDSP